MNVQTKILFALSLSIACGFAAISAAPNQGVEVTAASPNFADRGAVLDVEISGKGFDDQSTVAFYLPGTEDPEDITVNSVKFIKGSKKLIANISVGGDDPTLEAEFEIEVVARRGKGRGTTFFVFELNSGKTCAPWPGCKEDPQDPAGGLFTCEEIYGSPSCKNYDTGDDCMVSRGNDNTPGVTFVDDCTTQHTLVVPADDVAMFGGGFQLHLVAPWLGGRAAIVNADGTARVDGLTIVVRDPAIATGACAGTVGEEGLSSYAVVSAAVSLNPHRGDTGLPRMTAANLHISTLNEVGTDSGARFCNAIEYASHEFNVGNATSPLVVGGMTGNVIDEDSYSQFGLFTRYVNTGDGDAHVGISDNTIGFSADGCAAIKAGPWVEKLGVGDNTVVAPGGGGSSCAGIGIDIEYAGVPGGPSNAFQDDAPITISNNNVNTRQSTDATGIRVTQSAIGKNEGNEITCDAGDETYVFGTNVTDNTRGGLFPTKGKKKNVAIGSTTETIDETSFACP